VTKFQSTSPVTNGGTLVYTVTFTNSSGADLTLAMVDDLPTGTTLTSVSSSSLNCPSGAQTTGQANCSGTLAAGGSASITITATVNSGTCTGSANLVNRVRVVDLSTGQPIGFITQTTTC
jgi:uncharacterized repeat protein (TIGR01451 family)